MELEEYLVSAIGVLATVCAALFFQLQKAKQDLIENLKELLPVCLSVTKAVESLERQSEKLTEEVRKNVVD